MKRLPIWIESIGRGKGILEQKQAKIQERGVTVMNPALSIVLVCWNNKEYLDQCLNSLYDTGMRNSFDVIVVDNGSTDGSQHMLSEKYPQVRLVQNDSNLGLGKASNQGIEATQGRYVLLLNNDTIVNGAAFDAMVDFLEDHPRVGAVGGKILNPDGSVQSCYNYFSTLWEEFLIATRLGELFRPGYPSVMNEDEVKAVDWLTSACLMVRRATLDRVGLLDENYFIYGDEADLQYRIKKAGWEIYYLPNATTIHYGGRSMTRWPRRKLVYRGKMLFYKNHYGTLKTFTLRVMLAVVSFFKMLYWGIVYLLPGQRELAQKEMRSNMDVIRLCFTLA
jgi:N-acetylglucosaminyl-diphospho-decaprenol L-rhamnosyltransferase